MRLSCELELTYSLAVSSGGVPSRSSRSRAAITLGKKSGGGGRRDEELYITVSTAKNVTGSKYKVPYSSVRHTLKDEVSACVCVLCVCVCCR